MEQQFSSVANSGKVYPLLFNIAMENGPFIVVYLLKMVIFHGNVKRW
jgi:hypothetical protein